jgi:hypothetical protein
MQTTVFEPGREIKVAGQYDVLVAGGGIAGVSAALAAARNGAKVILVEKLCMLGGLATAGLVAFYLAICDGMGRQVCYGIAEELLKLSMKNCGKLSTYYDPWPWVKGGTAEEKKQIRYQVQFNPQTFALDMERLLRQEGVRILYDTTISDVVMEENKIKAVLVENKSGRSAYLVNSVVDATGDADICARAGVTTENYEEGNILAAWSYAFEKDSVKIKTVGAVDDPATDGKQENISDKRFSGLDGEENSDMLQRAHQIVLSRAIESRKTDDTYEIVTIPSMLQVRMSRHLVGEYILDEPEMHKEFPDSVGLISNWKKRGPVYEIPFRTLYNKSVPNLLCAGRCISVTDPMWDISRVIPPCAVTGEAAGTAAAMCSDFTELCVQDLQKKLQAAGVRLHESELEK